MKEYQYSIDIPHSAQQVWTLMNDYDKWPEFAKPMVTGINVVKPGDEKGNGLVREVKFKLPIGLSGRSRETIYDVEPGVGYTYSDANATVPTLGKLRLEKLGPNSTRLHFEERIQAKWPLVWFEGRIQKFIAQYNRKTILNMSKWLTEHPEY
jgi:hypothetical protein